MTPFSTRTSVFVRLGLLSTVATGCVALALVAAQPLRAQDANTVVARVNGADIHQSDVNAAEAELGPSLAQMDPATRRDNIIAFLIDLKIVAKAAEDKKIGDTPDFKQKLAFTRNRLLMDGLLANEGKAAVTDAALHKVYDEAAKQISGEQEVHARHILLETEDQAKEVVAELKKGADFAELAKKKSKDPGASDGGDLGFFTKDRMVPEFAEAAFSQKVGQVSQPVRTQFGWHVIKVTETKEAHQIPYDEVKTKLIGFLKQSKQRDAVQNLIKELRDSAKVENNLPPAPEPPAAPADAVTVPTVDPAKAPGGVNP